MTASSEEETSSSVLTENLRDLRVQEKYIREYLKDYNLEFTNDILKSKNKNQTKIFFVSELGLITKNQIREIIENFFCH